MLRATIVSIYGGGCDAGFISSSFSVLASFAGVLDLAFAGGADSFRVLLGALVGLTGARVGLIFCSGGATIVAGSRSIDLPLEGTTTGVVAAMFVGPDACSIYGPADAGLRAILKVLTTWGFAVVVFLTPFPGAAIPAGGGGGPGGCDGLSTITWSSILGFM